METVDVLCLATRFILLGCMLGSEASANDDAFDRCMHQDACRRYKTTLQQDEATIDDPEASPRQKVAARLLRIEKSILGGERPKNAKTACVSTDALHPTSHQIRHLDCHKLLTDLSGGYDPLMTM